MAERRPIGPGRSLRVAWFVAAVSEADAHGPGSGGTTLERGKEEVLNAARPLSPDEEVLIGDLSEEEDRLFLEAIMSA